MSRLLLAAILAVAAPAVAQRATHADVLRLQPRIDKAIDAGVEWLLGNQNRDGTWGYRESQYRGGQTALCTYTLLKAGLAPTHPGVAKALAFLESTPPRQTYTAACHMLAFGATGLQRYRKRMQAVLDDLLDWQSAGVWGYPFVHRRDGWADHMSRPDLSNTQYAALGLWAAQRAGLVVPPKAWTRLMNRTLKYQARPRSVKPLVSARPAAGTVATRTKMAIAGFHYTPHQGKPTGSMTTAGIAILGLAEGALGASLGDNKRREIRAALELGLGWLDHNFSLTRNPGNSSWLYYYLYGLERVGSILGVTYLGDHHWYYEGAEFLVGKQKKDGSWSQVHAEPDTCFAILFLKRATATTTGEAKKPRGDIHVAEDGKHDVHLRGTGTRELAVWITGFGKHVRERHTRAGLRVAHVEYLVDGKPVADVPGEPGRTWSRETYPARHVFAARGDYQVSARVHVVDPAAPVGATGPLIALTCPGFRVGVRHVPAASELPEAAGNLLPGRKATAAASTEVKGNPARHAFDGLESTRWLCKRDDARPELVLSLKGPVQADTIVLTQADGKAIHAGHFDRITRVTLILNRKQRFRIDLDREELRPTVFRLPKPRSVRSLRICIEDRVPGSKQKGRAGFAEIGLYRH